MPEPPCQRDAIDDYYTATKDEVLVVPYAAGLGINDVLQCGGPGYTIDDLTDPPNGTVVKTPNDFGAFEYTPDPGSPAPTRSATPCTRGSEVADQATAHITVTESCSVIAFSDIYFTAFETPVAEPAPGFLGNDTVECQPFTTSVSVNPTNGDGHRRGRRRLRVHAESRVLLHRRVHLRDPRCQPGADGHERGHGRGRQAAVHRRRRRLLDDGRHDARPSRPRVCSATTPSARTPACSRSISSLPSERSRCSPTDRSSYVPDPGFVGQDSFTYDHLKFDSNVRLRRPGHGDRGDRRDGDSGDDDHDDPPGQQHDDRPVRRTARRTTTPPGSTTTTTAIEHDDDDQSPSRRVPDHRPGSRPGDTTVVDARRPGSGSPRSTPR